METRIQTLEKLIEQQGFVLRILLVVVIVDTSALLVLWGQQGVPDFDHIAVSLTVFQTLFGIAALYGFWALRGLTKEKAEEVAEREVRKIAQPLVGRVVQEHLQAIGFDPISDDEIARILIATGEEGKEAEHG